MAFRRPGSRSRADRPDRPSDRSEPRVGPAHLDRIESDPEGIVGIGGDEQPDDATPRRVPDPPVSLVLASGSPRRAELLSSIGARFTVDVPGIDEARRAEEPPADLVDRLARRKAALVARRNPGRVVLAADTVVVVDGDVLGKPADEDDARQMLRRLADRWHEVLTGVAVAGPAPDTLLSAVGRTAVRMGAYDDTVVEWYVGTGEPADKAGAYGIQGIGAVLVAAISGSWSNVVGLPIDACTQLLAAIGLFPPDWAGGPRDPAP